MTTTYSALTCPPRFGTARTDRPTLGARAGEVAKALGTNLMPWQQHVCDVALETDPDTGLLRYSQVVLTVPRQSGKTTLLLALMVLRCTRFGPSQTVTYTAQTRNAARKKWEDEHIKALDRSAFGRRNAYSVRRSNGSESILFKNGSRWGVDAPSKKAGHGDTLDLGVIDEGFAHEDDRVEQAMAPAMITRPSKQLWVCSTAGDASSRYLYAKVVAGRANIGDSDGPTAYFEWSAPDDADPEDPAVWAATMPALGSTIETAAIRAELDKAKRQGELDLFARAYLNRWVEVPILDGSTPKVLPLEWFDDCVDKRSKIEGERVFAVDLTPDRATAAIVAVGTSTRGGTHVEVVDHRPGAGAEWVVPRLTELIDKWPTKFVTAHTSGPIGSLEGALQTAIGARFRATTDVELTRSCGLIFDGIRDKSLVHIGEPTLRAALDGAAKTAAGDAWRWSRKSSSVDISPLMAATIGWFAHVQLGPVGPELSTFVY